jgi:hypothetical protein
MEIAKAGIRLPTANKLDDVMGNIAVEKSHGPRGRERLGGDIGWQKSKRVVEIRAGTTEQCCHTGRGDREELWTHRAQVCGEWGVEGLQIDDHIWHETKSVSHYQRIQKIQRLHDAEQMTRNHWDWVLRMNEAPCIKQKVQQWVNTIQWFSVSLWSLLHCKVVSVFLGRLL